MKGLPDVVKGRIEEAAGALTGNNKLRARGRADQAIGHVKQDAEKCVQSAERFAQQVVHKAIEVGQEAIEKAQRRG